MTTGLGSGPLDVRSKAEKLADAVEESIRTGETLPGSRLGTKAQLGAAFAVAPATMDTALRLLVDRGLVEVRQGAKGGVLVVEEHKFLQLGQARFPMRHLTSSHPATARQVASVALTLEPLVIAEAVQSSTRSDRAKLQAAARVLAAVESAADYSVAHRAVHLALLAATHNAVLVSLVPRLWSSVLGGHPPPAPSAGVDVREWVAARSSVHLRIVDAVVGGDLAIALTALNEHGATGHDLDGMTAGYVALRQATQPNPPAGLADPPRRNQR